MAYPYITSGGLIQQTFQQFRKSFPGKVEAETLKKLGIASSNESFVIAILKFLHLIGDDNTKTPEGTKLFTSHKDEDFQKLLAELVQKAYSGLFELHGPESWKLDKDALITFFRGTDGTSAIVGARQANTFATLASLAGKRDEQVVVKTGVSKKASTSQSKGAAKTKITAMKAGSGPGSTPIRNPRGHEFDVEDSPEACLDHLTFASMLMRRLEEAGFEFD